MEERRRSNRKPSGMGGKGTLFAIFGVLIVGMFGSIYSAQNDKPTEVKKEVKAEDMKEKKKPEVTADLEHATPETISSELKKYSEVITGAKVKGKTLIVQYKDSAFWSDNTMVESYALDSIRLIEDLYKNKNFDLFAFERSTVMTDDNGNEELEPVLKSYYTRKTLDQMNLDNFSDMVLVDRERYFQKADGYWIHLGIFRSLKESLSGKINAPINFENMDESRYDMHPDATNDVVEKPESVEKEEPIVAEPVTEESAPDPQPEATYDVSTIVNSIYLITQGFDMTSFKISELNDLVQVSDGKVQAPVSSALFELKSMLDPIGKEITTLQQISTPADLKATTQQLAANQTELNRLYAEIQQQFYTIDKQDYSNANQLVNAIKQNFNAMEQLMHPDVSSYTTFFKQNADEQGS
ncbi:hypothetical protein SFC11_08390 [Exiguobacterium indicum]|uniref:hypothetical protein n=1 Tax=Exiguobacterium indicum TaxID=296995 RepID=UPI0039823C40